MKNNYIYIFVINNINYIPNKKYILYLRYHLFISETIIFVGFFIHWYIISVYVIPCNNKTSVGVLGNACLHVCMCAALFCSGLE